jgi:hypothetical protein
MEFFRKLLAVKPDFVHLWFHPASLVAFILSDNQYNPSSPNIPVLFMYPG